MAKQSGTAPGTGSDGVLRGVISVDKITRAPAPYTHSGDRAQGAAVVRLAGFIQAGRQPILKRCESHMQPGGASGTWRDQAPHISGILNSHPHVSLTERDERQSGAPRLRILRQYRGGRNELPYEGRTG